MNSRCEQRESALVSRSREYIGLVEADSELSHLSEAEVEEESLIAALTAMSLAGNPVELEAVRPGSGVSHPDGLGRERVRTKFESSPLFENDPDLTANEIARCGTVEATRLYWLARDAEPPEVDTELIAASTGVGFIQPIRRLRERFTNSPRSVKNGTSVASDT